jgi:monoamine oxidase
MARSLWLRTIKKALGLATLSVKKNIPVENVYEAYLSRRNLIRAGLFTGGLLTACTLTEREKTPATSEDTVLIVGAGIAGVTAGYRLLQKNVPIKIIEASDRVGGRIFSKSNVLGTDKTTELGGEFIDSAHKTMLSLAKEMGLEVVDLQELDKGLTEEIWFFNNRKIEFSELAQAFVPLAKQIAKDVERIGDFNYRNASPIAKALDSISLGEYLRKYARNPLLEKLLAVAYTIEYGREPEEQSCFNLIFLVGTDEELVLFGESDERYSILGGNQQIPQKLADKLANFISLNNQLESIKKNSDGRYLVSVRQDGSSTQETYRRILITLPFSILRTIDLQLNFPPLKERAIKELGYGYNAKLISSFRDKVWRSEYKSNGAVFTDLPWQNTWETAKYAKSKGGLITNYLGGKAVLNLSSNGDREGEKFIGSFQQVFPAIKDNYQKSLLMDWHKLPLYQSSYSCYLVGQTTLFSGIQFEPFENIYFAGEHCSTEFQGYMEGACATGEAAAQLIMKS